MIGLGVPRAQHGVHGPITVQPYCSFVVGKSQHAAGSVQHGERSPRYGEHLRATRAPDEIELRRWPRVRGRGSRRKRTAREPSSCPSSSDKVPARHDDAIAGTKRSSAHPSAFTYCVNRRAYAPARTGADEQRWAQHELDETCNLSGIEAERFVAERVDRERRARRENKQVTAGVLSLRLRYRCCRCP